MKDATRLPFLDGLRGVAIGFVFLFHCLGEGFGWRELNAEGFYWNHGPTAQTVLYPLTYGWAGVALFFVLSGFCIHLSHLTAKQPGWRVFGIRRFFRIFPPYLAVLLVFALVPPFGTPDVSPKQLLSHILLIHNYHPDSYYGINPSFWSIAVEAQLYVLYPLLWWGARRYGWEKVMLVAVLIEVGLQSSGSAIPAVLAKSPFSVLASWAVGAWIASCHHTRLPLPLARNWLLVPAFGLALVPTPFGLNFLGWALVSAVILCLMLSRPGSIPSGWLWQGLVSLGTVSYGFYLLHQPVLAFLSRQLPGSWASFVGCLVSGLPLFAASFLFYRFVEQPSIHAGKRLIRAALKTGQALSTVGGTERDSG